MITGESDFNMGGVLSVVLITPCIIVVEINTGSGKIHTGIVVDSVSEVLNIKSSDIEDTPSFGTSLNTDYILGMAKMGGGVKILLEIDRVLNSQELEALEAVS